MLRMFEASRHRNRRGSESARFLLRGGSAQACLATILLGTAVPAVAQVDSCSQQIARVEQDIRSSPAGALSLPQSRAATLHRQPTEASVAGAEQAAKGKLDEALARARALASEGKDSECVAVLREADPLLGE